VTVAAAAAAALLLAAPAKLEPRPDEKCPVCGMFVVKHPNWIAEIRFADGTRVVFDGAKDLFKLFLKVKDYGPPSRRTDIAEMRVLDYYALEPVSVRDAWFVVGSDVYGPMGHELIPFRKEADAREFLADHHGERVLRFAEVTRELVEALDREPD
jgi:nitrous oxide reductase accessory protein NosL